MGEKIKRLAKPIKKVKAATEETPIAEVNKKVTLQKIVIHRELKYKYPRGMVDPLKRKAHRAKIRNKIKSFAMQIVKLTGDARAKIEQEMLAYEKENTYS